MPEQPSREASALRAWALVGQVGLTMAASIVAGVIGGVYLDAWLGGTGIVLVIMILLGVGGGVAGVYGLLAKELSWKR